MSDFHKYFGYAIPTGFGILALWVIYCLIRNKQPADRFWTLLGIMQVFIGLQVVVGAILFVMGLEPPTSPVWLHYAYGGLFPAALLMLAHRLGSSRFESVPWIPFGAVSFLICGLTVRALMTGLGA
jgi:heme A synthase